MKNAHYCDRGVALHLKMCKFAGDMRECFEVRFIHAGSSRRVSGLLVASRAWWPAPAVMLVCRPVQTSSSGTSPAVPMACGPIPSRPGGGAGHLSERRPRQQLHRLRGPGSDGTAEEYSNLQSLGVAALCPFCSCWAQAPQV